VNGPVPDGDPRVIAANDHAWPERGILPDLDVAYHGRSWIDVGKRRDSRLLSIVFKDVGASGFGHGRATRAMLVMINTRWVIKKAELANKRAFRVSFSNKQNWNVRSTTDHAHKTLKSRYRNPSYR
jgi:hypothetical protein